jgi:hypothetical protein
MSSHTISTVTPYILRRRVETMQETLIAGSYTKFYRIVDCTMDMITHCESNEVHPDNVGAYIKNIDMAQMLCYLGLPCRAILYLNLAIDVIVRDLATMTPAYMLLNRISSGKDIGSLSELPRDVVHYISEIVTS